MTHRHIETETRPLDDFGTIGNLLRQPVRSLDLNEFSENLAVHGITFRLEALAQAARDPALLGRIRGAFGEELLRGASPQSARGEPCPWEPPCAFETLFRKQDRMKGGIDFPNPWVLSLTPHRDDLLVRMCLFGLACEWDAAAAEALTVALLSGVDWKASTGSFASAPRIASRNVEVVTVPWVEVRQRLILDFMSPLVISRRDAASNPQPAFTTFGLRLEGIARWHGWSLEQVDWRAVAKMLHALSWEWEEVAPVAWRRGSLRQNKLIPMQGVVGRLVVSGAALSDPVLSALFRVGALVHVGADIAFGCGRYEIRE